jgi:phage anti-repressor protein
MAKINKRDYNILKAYSREVDMKEKTYKSKKHYNRKIKHKNKMFEY